LHNFAPKKNHSISKQKPNFWKKEEEGSSGLQKDHKPARDF
jgi:hypothetical protein